SSPAVSVPLPTPRPHSVTFLFSRSGDHRDLLSFPTRRSSDLVGPSSEPGAHIGPVISKAQYERIQGLIDTGIKEGARLVAGGLRSEEHTSELQSRENLVCRLLLEKKKEKESNSQLRKTREVHR